MNSSISFAAASASARDAVSTGVCMYFTGTETMAVATPWRLTWIAQPSVPLERGMTSI